MSWGLSGWRAVLMIALLAIAPGASPQSRDDAKEALPEGEGKQILLTACTTCHDLDEVTKRRGSYGADEWRDIVRTMVEYGARVDDEQARILVEYLARHLGRT